MNILLVIIVFVDSIFLCDYLLNIHLLLEILFNILFPSSDR